MWENSKGGGGRNDGRGIGRRLPCPALRSLSGWYRNRASPWPNHEKHSYLPSILTGVGCQPLKPVCEPETESCTDGSADKLVQFRSRPVSFLYLAAGLLTTSCPTGSFHFFSAECSVSKRGPKSGFVVLHAMRLNVEYMTACTKRQSSLQSLYLYWMKMCWLPALLPPTWTRIQASWLQAGS